MSEKELPLEELGPLAEQVMSDKREDLDHEGQARELYDLPSMPPGNLPDTGPENDAARRGDQR